MMYVRIAVVGIALCLATFGMGHSQETWTLDLTPQIGYFRTANDFGPATPVSQSLYLSIREVDPTVSLGLQADLALPLDGLALTFRGMATLPSAVEGGLGCLPGYYCLPEMPTVESEMRTLGGAVGLLYRPWSGSGPIRPFVTAGVGLNQERHTWSRQENGFLPGTGQSETSKVFLAGIGFDLNLRSIPLRLEITDVWTPEGDEMPGSLGPNFSSAWPPRRASRHDLNISVGWVLDLN
jgi:hypothetical protein